jgi:hypothetical protein
MEVMLSWQTSVSKYQPTYCHVLEKSTPQDQTNSEPLMLKARIRDVFSGCP